MTDVPEKVFEPRLFLVLGVSIPFQRGGDKPELRFEVSAATSATTADPEAETFVFAWKAKTFGSLQPGAIYELEATTTAERTSIRFAPAKWRGQLSDDERREAIMLADRAARTTLGSFKKREELRKASLDLAAILDPLRPHYRKCLTVENQIAFETAVLAALRRGR